MKTKLIINIVAIIIVFIYTTLIGYCIHMFVKYVLDIENDLSNTILITYISTFIVIFSIRLYDYSRMS